MTSRITASGTPAIIQSRKPMSMPSPWRYPTSRVLGGVPMMVPNDPIDAA